MTALRRELAFAFVFFVSLLTAPALLAQSYQNNRRGLEKLTEHLLQAAQKNQAGAFQSLAIQDHAAWFESTFGSGPGAALAALYETHKSELADKLSNSLAARWIKGRPKITVLDVAVRVDADLDMMNAVARPMNELQMYRVLLEDGRDQIGFDVGYFVFLDGGFRYIGRLYVIKENARKRLLFRSADAAVTQPLVKTPQVRPRYPDAAKQARTQGTVLLQAVILEDGSLDEVEVVQGLPILAGAARDAVAQWKYRPLEIEGKKYKAVILVPVAFTLRF